MKQYKLILLTVFYILCVNKSYSAVCFNSDCFYKDMIKEICEYPYNNTEINTLEKLANEGDINAQLKLAIFYDIKSVQKYQEVLNHSCGLEKLWEKRQSSCDSTNNNL
ncbi:hypothetical protein PT286_01855 [Neisseriaceae bacterium ESL0693]|nr:hypothetical protein [Neisseriaceae bacterium ESL0693]